MENTDYPYVTCLDILYPHLELIDVPEMVAACTVPVRRKRQ